MPAVAPTYLRLQAPRAAPAGPVDREAKVIRGASVITRGEALGHEHWVDLAMVDRVVELGNASARGIKARWTHPGLSADGLGTYLGRMRDFRRDGDRALADLHLSELSTRSPTKGDMASYVLDLAEKEPDSFGLSITFLRDLSAMAKHQSEHGGNKFRSPDALNTGNLPHLVLDRLNTADVVDDPAANPGGFLTSHEEFASRAEAVLDYGLGRSEADPSQALGLPAGRVRDFMARYLARHQLRVLEAQKMEELQRLAAEVEALKAETMRLETERDAALEALAEHTAQERARQLDQLRQHVARIGPTPQLAAQIDRVAALWELDSQPAHELARGMADEILGLHVELKGSQVEQPRSEPKDFMAEVHDLSRERQMPLGQAVMQIASTKPELHRAWIQAQQGRAR